LHSLVALLLLLLSCSAMADCDELQSLLGRQKQTLDALEVHRARLDNLLQGQVDDQFVLTDSIPRPLDDPLQVLDARVSLTKALAAIPNTDNLPVPPQFADCPEQAAIWLGQEKQIFSQQEVINRLLLNLYELPRASRLSLMRELNQWQALHQVETQVISWARTQAEQTSAQELADSISQWINDWRSSTRLWLGQLVSTEPQHSKSNDVWNATLQVPDPTTAIDWESPLADGAPADLHNWQDTMVLAHRALLRESSIWRNRRIWNQGWGNLLQDMSHPRQFWEQLSTEIRSAPINLADALARPFIRTYRQATQTNTLGEALASWFLQSLALVAIMSALLKLATFAPQYISRLQQQLMSSLQHKALLQINSAILWLVKPNAPWAVVLVGANLIARQLPDHWTILLWLAPIGTLYAAFRAVRVAVDWLMARTFTRSGQFVSAEAAQEHTRDAQRVSWMVLLCLVTWILVRGTGGGYLMFLVVIVVTIVIWGSLMWLLLRYREAVARFLLYVAGKGTSKKLDPASAQRGWMLAFWPALFLLAHLLDNIIHLHQKALVFDTYRSISVKIMRIRLAAESREEDEEESGEDASLPDESYADWVLRNNRSWIDAVDMNKLIKPIEQWHKDKSDDNVLLIVGDQGSGKTALVNHLANNWKDTPISILNIPAKTTDPDAVLPLIGNHLCIPDLKSIGELVKLDETLEPQVVVLDNTHNLFLSEVGYLNAYRALSQCLNAHLNNIFWVVVMHAPSWTYLSCVFKRELRFSQIYRMPRWSPGDIRRLILSRHQGSRRRIRYDELLMSASAGSESSSIRAADSRVFNILWEQSSGNPQVAIQLWLDAARSKDKVVELGVPSRPAGTALKDMKEDLGFVFAAIVIHKSLSSEEIMRVTHFPDAIVRHALKQGTNLGLVWRDDSKRYRIQPAWQGTLNSYLASKNLLWEI